MSLNKKIHVQVTRISVIIKAKYCLFIYHDSVSCAVV